MCVRGFLQDPYHYHKYLANSQFLADINNERQEKNQKYKDNMLSLEQLVLVRFSDDVLVVPKDSAWVGDWDGHRLQSMNETDLYQVICLLMLRFACCFVLLSCAACLNTALQV